MTPSSIAMRRAEVLAAGTGLLAAALPLRAAAQSASPAPAALRVGALAIESAAEGYYAQQIGAFRRYGIDADVQTLTNAGALVSAVLAGALDVTPTNIVTLAQAHAKGLPIVLIAPGAVYTDHEPTTELAVAIDAPYQTPRDLNGKKIAVLTLGGFLQVAVLNWLDRNGGDAKSVTFLELPSPEIVPALQAKRVDAAGLPEPFLSNASAHQSVRFVGAPYSSVGKSLSLSGWVAHRDWVAANPDLVQRFQAAIRDTALWANRDRAGSAAILTGFTRIPPATIAAMRRDPFGIRVDAATIQPIVDVCARYNLIPQGFPANAMFAPNVS